MGGILVSLAVKGGLSSVIIVENGLLKQHYTEKIKDDEARSNNYLATLYSFNMALRHTRQYIQDNPGNREVTFELSSSTFIKWVDTQYSKPAYQDKFMETMDLLQSLPIRYSFSYNAKPRALSYASGGAINTQKVGGLLD